MTGFSDIAYLRLLSGYLMGTCLGKKQLFERGFGGCVPGGEIFGWFIFLFEIKQDVPTL